MQLRGQSGLAGDIYWKIGESEAVDGESHTIDKVEILFQVC